MKNNLGEIKTQKRRKSLNSWQQFDCLPRYLREWLANAVLPWAPISVQRVYKRALSRSGNHCFAMEELDRLQEYQLAKKSLNKPGALVPR